MTVKELINDLQQCNPDDIVLYDMRNMLENKLANGDDELTADVDEVLIGYGITKGFVYLQEEKYETD